MLYEKGEVELAFKALKISPAAYLLNAGSVARWLEGGRDRWKLLGPYWGLMQSILAKRFPGVDTPRWNDGDPPPDFLSLYDYGSDELNLCAAMMYLNRASDTTDVNVDLPHSVITPDGEVLYIPGVGIVDP